MITTWVLILYLSTGIADIATGGPTTIDGFSTKELCEAANLELSTTLRKYDWGQCVRIIK